MKKIRWLVILALAGAVGIPVAHAHLWDDGPGGATLWFFEGTTFGNDAGTQESDPINILFVGDSTREASSDSVGDHLLADWHRPAGGGPADGRRMDRHQCLNARFSRQWMVWLARSQVAPGAGLRDVERHDDSYSTNRWCRDQWHIRVWDDQEHDEQTTGHGDRNQWVAANIHHDHFIGVRNGWHAVDQPWEVGERTLYRRMSEHCRYLGWKVHPGAQGPFGRRRFQSDGKLTVILMKHIADPGTCPGPPGH
jgi:hypothetical protein